MSQDIGDLRPYLVEVLQPNGTTVRGTGFVCHPQGFILTCYHVVAPWVTESNEALVVYQGTTHRARFQPELSAQAGDLAVLRCEKPTTHETWPHLPLDTYWRVKLGDKLHSYGFPQGKDWLGQSGLPMSGEMGGLTPLKSDGVEVYPITGLNLTNVDGGYSGAPLISQATQKVIGLMHAKYERNQAFMVPLTPVFERWPELKGFHDVTRQIREHLINDANTALQDKLKTSPFISLALEVGRFPDKRKHAEAHGNRGLHQREWEPSDINDLLQPNGKKVLSADVGTGKTTLLCWLTKELLSNECKFVPLLLSCAEFETHDSWEDVKCGLIKRYKRFFLEPDLDFFFESGPTMFLCDGLDQITTGQFTAIARRILRISDDRPVLIASRPSAVLSLENERDIAFFTLQPFSLADQRRYFGEHYPEAKRLVSLSPKLAQVPMLAYMIQTLIVQGEASETKTRTSLYRRFITYVLTTHSSNQPFIDTPSWTNKIRASLCLVAYRALAEPEPRLQRIEASFYEGLANFSPLEQVTRFGLVNLVLERGDHALFFTHYSFQEFLAAEYLNQHRSEIEGLMGELWNPKWAGVIEFLAGLIGEPFIQNILGQSENVIHSNCFLATRCAREVDPLSPQSRKRIVDCLLALADRPPFTSDAINALGSFQDSQLFIPFLASDDPNKRNAAIKALKELGYELDPDTIHLIELLLENENPRVRESALSALEEQSEHVNSRAVRVIVGCLRDEDRSVYEKAIEVLKQLARCHDSEARQAISDHCHAVAKHLENGDPFVRRDVVNMLATFEELLDANTIRAMARRLEDVNSMVRGVAIHALGLCKEGLDAEYIPVIVAHLSDRDGYPRKKAANTLYVLRERVDSETIHAIAAHLGNEDREVRRAALEVLGRLVMRLDVATIEAIAAHLEDDDLTIREMALDVLARVGGRLGSGGVRAIACRLVDEAVQVRTAAIRASAQLWGRLEAAEVRTLMARLEDKDADVRATAIRALAQLGDGLGSHVTRAIASHVGDEALSVRCTSIGALAQLAGRLEAADVHTITARLEDGDPYVRATAVRALAQLGERLGSNGARAVASHLVDEAAQVRSAAIETLAQLGGRLDAAEVRTLMARLEDEDADVRENAIDALAQLGDGLGSDVTRAIIKRFADRNGVVRQAALEALSRLRDRIEPETIQVITKWLNHRNLTRRALAYTACKTLYQKGNKLPLLGEREIPGGQARSKIRGLR